MFDASIRPSPAGRVARAVTAVVASTLVAGLLALTPPPPAAAATTEPAPDSGDEPGIGILAAGVPEAAPQVWSEDFEDSPSAAATLISAWPSAASPRYGADPYWRSAAACNGYLVSFAATFSGTTCTESVFVFFTSDLSRRQQRRMADVLGQVAAGVPGSATTPAQTSSTAQTRANRALGSTTQTAGSANQRVLESGPLALTAQGPRYYAFSLAMAAEQCATNPAVLDIALVVGGSARAMTAGGGLDACTIADGRYISPDQPASGVGNPALTGSTSAGRLTAGTAVRLSAAEAQQASLRITNRNGGSNANAFAIDDLRLVDATPSLDVGFESASVVGGTPIPVTFTVTNTTELAAKSDWSFAAALPSGLAVADAPNVGGTCTNDTGVAYEVAAAAGSSSISVTGGDLANGTESCTVTVDVVSPTAGTYTLGPGDVTTTLIAPEPASVEVTPPTTITLRKVVTARDAPGDQFRLSLREGTTVLATATTSGAATGLQNARIDRRIVEPGSTYTIHENVVTGAGLNYGAAYECVLDGTVVAAGSSPAGAIATPDAPGADIVCTFTNTPQPPRLACDDNRLYGIGATGALVQGDIVAGASVTVGSWSGAASANGLGVGAGGTLAHAFERSSDATDVAAMLRWTPSGGFQTVAGSSYTTVNAAGTEIGGSLVAGAIDLTGSQYYFGKFFEGQFHIWRYTHANAQASRYAYVGSFSAGSAPNGNGDMAFDSRGNLYVVGATATGGGASAVIFTVTAERLAAGGNLGATATTPRGLNGLDASPAMGNVNGIAFSPSGTAYLSGTSSAYEFDPTTWTRVPGTPRLPMSVTDLAACSSPATVTVLKHVVGRAASSDQFTLALRNGDTEVATATTSGTATGRQNAQIGPVPVPVRTTLGFGETMAAGSASALGVYTSVTECWSEGRRLSTSAAPSGTVTMPDRLSVNVVCTVFNSPRPASNVTLTKQVVDPATGTAAPAEGWRLGVSATATTGTATVLPSEAPWQTTDAAGTAAWSVLFGSAASRATLTISEQQQTGFVLASVTCTVNGSQVPVETSTSGSIVRATLPGIASASAVACTLTNRPVASLTLAAEVSYGELLPTDWTLRATAPAGALTGPAGRSGSAGVNDVPVTPGAAYRLAFSGGSPAYVSPAGWECTDGEGATVPVSPAGEVTPAPGADVTCTIAFATATITLLKQVQDPQPRFQAEDWTITATPAALDGAALPVQSRRGAEYSPANIAANTVEVRPAHEYALSEAPTEARSRIAYRTLRLERLEGDEWVAVSADITAPAAGESAVYRFVNAPVTPTELPLTGGQSTDSYVIGGSAVLTLALAGALWHGLRRRRRTA